jgi:bacterioferritin (cytochrome b1)
MPAGSFTADITAIRKRARQKMEEGPVTGSYGKDPKEVIAERIVITTYQEIIRWIGDGDPTTRRLPEGILADEEEHADDLVDLLGA